MAARERSGNGKPRPIIIKREEVSGGGHHGGAWKVAYADFVTAMMAFFLVMWLINATTEAQRKGLADYFSPTNLLSHNSSGTGKPFGGETAFSNGAMVSDKGAVEVTQGLHPVLDNPIPPRRKPSRRAPHGGRGQGRQGATAAPGAGGGGVTAAAAVGPAGVAHKPGAPPRPAGAGGAPPLHLPSGPAAGPRPLAPPAAALAAAAATAAGQQAAFAAARAALRRALSQDPALAAIAGQLAVDITPRGLRIQLLDSKAHAMFAPGSTVPNALARRALRLIGQVVAKLPGPVRIAGFTDASAPTGPAANWALSAGRANAARGVLTRAGLADARVEAVTGHGSHDLLLPAQPLAAANRRISILVLRAPPPR
ncbi:MAG: flagellar motor protein MotB [Acetobacteraceae bacterium]